MVGIRNKTAVEIKRSLLNSDIEQIREMIAARTPYVLAVDIDKHCKRLGLSTDDLAGRCLVSTAAVKKWLTGKASPCGKERMKELGMALEMDEKQLNEFLLYNAYPRFSYKNPLDNVCRLVLRQHRGNPEIVAEYRAEIAKSKAGLIRLPKNRVSLSSDHLLKCLAQLNSGEDLPQWLQQFSHAFSATGKTMLPSSDLMNLVVLFLGEKKVYTLYKNGVLPVSVSRELYSIKGNEELTARGLRQKLIVFGLCSNLSEQDLDTLLKYAGLLPFSMSKTKLDIAVWAAMNYGHDRYPYYEFDSLWQLHHDLVDILYDQKINGESTPEMYKELLASYKERLSLSETCVLYYDEHKNKADRRFEYFYTDSYEDRNRRLQHYVCDILWTLAEAGDLPKKDVINFFKLM